MRGFPDVQNGGNVVIYDASNPPLLSHQNCSAAKACRVEKSASSNLQSYTKSRTSEIRAVFNMPHAGIGL
jgi:hypothetical protein